MAAQVLDYSLTNFKVPGLAPYTPPFGTKKADGSGLTTTEITRNEMMPFMKQRSISGVPPIAGNDPPMGMISEDSIATPIEFNANFAVDSGVTLQLDDPNFEGQEIKIVASFSSGTPALIILGIAGTPQTVALEPEEILIIYAVNGKWRVFAIGTSMNDGDVNLPFYARSNPFLVASAKRKILIKAGTKIDLPNGQVFSTDIDLEADIASILDTGTIANGKDYYIFLCPQGNNIVVRVSLSKLEPMGFAASDIILVGGFHTLCASVGTGLIYVEGGVTKNHPLNGYIAGDILPASVWCLNHRPYSEPEGMVYISALDFWCDIYLQSGSGTNTKSVYQGALTRSRQYVDFVEDQFCVKKELLDDGEFAASMLGSNEMTAVAGASEAGATTGGAGGRVDTAGRRMISIYGVEEGCGSLWQWLRTTSASGYDGVIHQQTSAEGVTPVTYGLVTVTSAAHGPFPQSGGKGSFWGVTGALLAGGYWLHAATCGSRCRDAINARSRASASIGGRGRSRAMRFVR